ncbi:hypothetical protein [Paenibacillus terreus]|uniref:hypothetical protein n=1 Tax=Paenibacillus terreus TaxID=1387834 RepID=UPI0035CD2A57
MLDYFRNKKIKQIFSRFPSIDHTEQEWLVNDLKARGERLRSDIHLHGAIEINLIKDRIDLIDEAIYVMTTNNYRDNLEKCMIVKKVYATILK